MEFLKRVCAGCLWYGLLALACGPAYGQRDLTNIPDPDPELERSSFVVAEGLEVNLFAGDPLLAKPIQMNFDAQGRLWIASSEVYPHIAPGQPATDKILVLEDKDRDGVAESRTVFADGLLIPTGVVPGDGGVYVANSTELLHLRDTNGDGRADEREVILSGFGTEDTHHLLHTLRWGHDGALYMNQSIYIHSHVETPYGVRHLNGGGIWRFRPESLKLDVLCRGFVNPWGHHFDYWGQSFATDGAYGEGINYVFPGAIYVTAPGESRRIKGLNPGSPKHCGLEIISGRHFPDDWTGSMITNDFRAHRVCRFVVTETATGYASRQENEIIKSSHVAFRPIDAKLGPDGALYIADWYNPIIQHGEVDFRDERRDHVHGRIWRVTAKGRALLTQPPIVRAPVADLLELLKVPEEWVRLHAKLELKQRGAAAVVPALEAWLTALDPNDARVAHHRLEALWLYQNLDVVREQLLRELLGDADHRVRAAAMRIVPQWRDRLSAPNTLLVAGTRDPHSRVRLEAVRGLAAESTAQAALQALAVLDQPLDEYLDFALWQAMRDLQPSWLPALQRGELDFAGKTDYLAYALSAVESADVAGPLLKLVRENRISAARRHEALTLVVRSGGPVEIGQVFDMVLDGSAGTAPQRAQLLEALVEAHRLRKVEPPSELHRLGELLKQGDVAERIAALRAVGTWKVESLRPALEPLAQSAEPESLNTEALDALAALGGPSSHALLVRLAETGATPALQRRAVRALASLDLPEAAQLASRLLPSTSGQDALTLLPPFLDQKAGPAILASALAETKLEADTARLLVRAVRQSANSDEALLARLQQAGGLSEAGWKYTPELARQLVAEAASGGNATRGEAVFRRAEFQCLLCHGIGGAGGKVGPDLSSLGASAQPDYLVESMLAPNAKVKENFHAVLVVADGLVYTGIPVRRTEQVLVLRDAKDQEVSIPIDAIEEEREGRSLMPDGTVDVLTRQELVDLIRFLSELGKIGEFALGQDVVVRRWDVLQPTPEAYQRIRRTSFDTAATEDAAFRWGPAISQVNGELPLSELPVFVDATFVVQRADSHTTFLRFMLDVEQAGELSLRFRDPSHFMFWVDGNPTNLTSDTLSLSLTAGRHTFTLAVDQKKRQTPLRVELLPASAVVRPVQ